ncbi:unnamed protein product [Trichobilharzia regenti]|nr:unnamed protein product [Trichobilharzia regenti]
MGTENPPTLNVPRPSAALPSLGDGLLSQTLRRQTRLYSQAQIMNQMEVKESSQIPQRKEVNENLLGGKDINLLQTISQDDNNSVSQTTARVPICGIVAGGNNSTMDHIYASVTLNRCPMVLVRVS